MDRSIGFPCDMLQFSTAYFPLITPFAHSASERREPIKDLFILSQMFWSLGGWIYVNPKICWVCDQSAGIFILPPMSTFSNLSCLSFARNSITQFPGGKPKSPLRTKARHFLFFFFIFLSEIKFYSGLKQLVRHLKPLLVVLI